jgi:predicted PurR-regulated permease PerM
MSKKNINTDDLNEIIDWGKKLLHLIYIVLMVAVILGVILFCQNFGIFNFLSKLLKILSPLFIGFIIAWLFNPLIISLRKKGFSKSLSTIVVYLIFVLLLALLIKVFIPLIYSQLNDFIKMIPDLSNSVSNYVSDLFNNTSGGQIDLSATREKLLTGIQSYGDNLSSNLPTTALNIIKGFFSGLGIFGLSLIIGVYMSFDFDKLSTNIIKIIPKKNQKEIFDLLNKIGEEVRKCVNGTLLVACMVFICDTVGFAIIGLDSALLFGFFCGLTDLIPYIGPYIGGSLAVLVGFSQNPLMGVGVLIIAVVVQCIENYVLQPMVMSRATQMNPVLIMVWLLIFGYFFGILGMILATPCLAILKVLNSFLIKKFNLFNQKKSSVVAD